MQRIYATEVSVNDINMGHRSHLFLCWRAALDTGMAQGLRDRALGSGSGMWHDFHLNADQSPPLSRKSQFSGPKHWQKLQHQLGHGDISN